MRQVSLFEDFLGIYYRYRLISEQVLKEDSRMRAYGAVMCIWWGAYFLAKKKDLAQVCANKGISIIQGEYWRFFTGLFLHVNLLHLLLNSIAFYWVCAFLETRTTSFKMIVFSLTAATLSNVCFSILYRKSISVGGSPIVFAMIGLIVIYALFGKDTQKPDIHSAYGRWILGFAIFGNIPIFSGNSSTLIIHSISLILGAIIAFVGLRLGIF